MTARLSDAQRRALKHIADECRFSTVGVTLVGKTAAHATPTKTLLARGLVLVLNGDWLVITDAGRAALEAQS